MVRISINFFCTDPGTQELLEFDENGTIVHRMKVDGYCFDVWALADDTYLYCHYGMGKDGVSVINRECDVLFCYETEGEVFGCPASILLQNIMTREKF